MRATYLSLLEKTNRLAYYLGLNHVPIAHPSDLVSLMTNVVPLFRSKYSFSRLVLLRTIQNGKPTDISCTICRAHAAMPLSLDHFHLTRFHTDSFSRSSSETRGRMCILKSIWL